MSNGRAVERDTKNVVNCDKRLGKRTSSKTQVQSPAQFARAEDDYQVGDGGGGDQGGDQGDEADADDRRRSRIVGVKCLKHGG
jgi:hypothetical protein